MPCPNAGGPLATASASAPAAKMLFVMGFVIGSSPSLRCSTLAPIAVVPAVIALAAVAGVRAIVLGGGSDASEARAGGARERLPVVARNERGGRWVGRRRGGRDGSVRRRSDARDGDRQRERAGGQDALRHGLRLFLLGDARIARSSSSQPSVDRGGLAGAA